MAALEIQDDRIADRQQVPTKRLVHRPGRYPHVACHSVTVAAIPRKARVRLASALAYGSGLWLTPTRKLMDARSIAGAVGTYLKDHPEELWRLLRNALAMRFGVPLAALRWLAVKGGGKKAPKDVQIDAVPPGVRLSASLDLMGTPVRASGVVYVERVRANEQELCLEL